MASRLNPARYKAYRKRQIMKQYRFQLVCILLLSLYVSSQSFEYPWMTSKSEILKTHKLTPLAFEPIIQNIKKYCKYNEHKFFDFYVVDSMTTNDYCGIGFYTFYGFYKDSLFFILQGTHELPYVKKDPKDSCITANILINDTLDYWMLIIKDNKSDGNIFQEGGLIGHNSRNEYYTDKLISIGTLSNPTHLQYFYIFTSRAFIDIFNKNVNIYPDNFIKLGPSILFTRSIVGKYKKLQKPIDNNF